MHLTRNLGPDAVPELVGALPRLPAAIAGRIEGCLRQWYRRYPGDADDRWFEWSLRRAALVRALEEIKAHAAATDSPTATEAGSCRNDS